MGRKNETNIDCGGGCRKEGEKDEVIDAKNRCLAISAEELQKLEQDHGAS
jgi:hypothetical protein